MKRISRIALLTAMLASVSPALNADNHLDTNMTNTSLADAEKPSNVMGAAKGCAAGAVAGTVIPGLGNIIGCAIGGIFGWFW